MSRIIAQTQEKRFPVAPDLYGLFFEDISHAGDGGLYPDMLRNRSFEDSLLPEGCITTDNGKTFVSPTGWIDEFNNGEGMNNWVEALKPLPTPVPAWYADHAEASCVFTIPGRMYCGRLFHGDRLVLPEYGRPCMGASFPLAAVALPLHERTWLS